MKARIVTALCVSALLMGSVNSSYAIDDGPAAIVADVIVVRPACFAATVVGSAFFVVALPFAALSKSVKRTANTLVVRPAEATFKRPVGDLDSLVND